MNYYIDFDSTMYFTGNLVSKMRNSIINEIINQNNKLDKNILFEEFTAMFNKENIYDIYKLVEYFSDKYNLNLSSIVYSLDCSILNSCDLVFKDVIPFLKKIKEKGHKLYILSYGGYNLKYQSLKIAGSNLANYFDGIYLSAIPKYELDINYKNGIFIDDNPKDLLGLYSKNPIEVIRIRRPENKYSIKNLENCNIKEYQNFDEVPIV